MCHAVVFRAVVRSTQSDQPSYLGTRQVLLMTAVIQFLVLKRDNKWVIKSGDLERFFSMQREAVNAAIRSANDSGKEGRPGVVLFQKSKSEFEKIWTYGEDPYPPAKSDLPVTCGTPSPGKLADTIG